MKTADTEVYYLLVSSYPKTLLSILNLWVWDVIEKAEDISILGL